MKRWTRVCMYVLWNRRRTYRKHTTTQKKLRSELKKIEIHLLTPSHGVKFRRIPNEKLLLLWMRKRGKEKRTLRIVAAAAASGPAKRKYVEENEKEYGWKKPYVFIITIIGCFFFVILHDSIRFFLARFSFLCCSALFTLSFPLPFSMCRFDAVCSIGSLFARISSFFLSSFLARSVSLAPHSHKGVVFLFRMCTLIPVLQCKMHTLHVYTEEKHTHTKHIRRINSEYKEKHNRLIYKTHLLI